MLTNIYLSQDVQEKSVHKMLYVAAKELINFWNILLEMMNQDILTKIVMLF